MSNNGPFDGAHPSRQAGAGREDKPIGVFDSGVGGLAVVEEIRKLLPSEDVVYYADRANFPYGPKSKEEVLRLSIAAVEFLRERGAKLVVVACNTASAVALTELRKRFPIPFVGIVPAIKPASLQTKSGKIGVLATEGTLHAEMFQALVDQFATGVEVLTTACPRLVELVEQGLVEGPEVLAAVRQYVDPMLEKGIDTLVLGCTHYSFLKEVAQEVVGPDIGVIETSLPVARQVQRLLRERELLSSKSSPGTVTYHASGDAVGFDEMRGRLLGVPSTRLTRPDKRERVGRTSPSTRSFDGAHSSRQAGVGREDKLRTGRSRT